MNIKQFSIQTGLSSHTLRYYEKIGLLKNIERNTSGHRIYSLPDLKWIEFIIRLKETNMPLEKIIIYAKLREQGDSTLLQRQQLLEEHSLQLKNSIDLQLKYLHELNSKINFYKHKISS